MNVEVTDNSRSITLPVVGKNPSAPLTPLFSYTCSGPLVFANENVTLTMQSIQVSGLFILVRAEIKFANRFLTSWLKSENES